MSCCAGNSRRGKDGGRKFPKIARNILVSMGGGDPDNATLTVLRALKKILTRIYTRLSCWVR